MIRRATPADLPRIVEMGRRNYEVTHDAEYYDPTSAEIFVRQMLSAEHAAVFVSDSGMIGGIVNTFWAAPGNRHAVEMFWFAEDGNGLRLLREFEAWARSKGAKEVRVTTRASAALERIGYEHVEVVYRRRI